MVNRNTGYCISVFFIIVFYSCKNKNDDTWYYVNDFKYDEIYLKEGNTYTNRYYVDFLLDGEKYSGILDTGSDLTSIVTEDCINKKYLKGELIKVDGSRDTLSLKSVKSIKLGKAEIKNKKIFLKPQKNYKNTENILGNEILRGAIVQFDHYDNRIKIATREEELKPKGIPVDCRFDHLDRIYVYLNVGGKTHEFLLDTGCYYELEMKSFINGIEIFNNSITMITKNGDKTIATKNIMLDVSLGRKTFINCRIMIGRSDYNLMGIGFLRRFKTVTIDYIKKRLFVELPENHHLNKDIKFEFDKDTIEAVPMEWLQDLYDTYNSYGFKIENINGVYKINSLRLSGTRKNTIDFSIGDTIIGVDNLLFSEKYLTQNNKKNKYKLITNKTEQLVCLVNTMWQKNEGVFHIIKNGAIKSYKLKRIAFSDNKQFIGYTYSKPMKLIPGMALNFYIDKERKFNIYIPWKKLCGKEIKIKSEEDTRIMNYTNISPDSLCY